MDMDKSSPRPCFMPMLDLSADVQHIRVHITAKDVTVQQAIFISALICKCAKKECHVDAGANGIISIDICHNV